MNYSSTRWLLLAFSALGVYYATSASGVPQKLVPDCAAGSVADGPLNLRASTPFSPQIVDVEAQTTPMAATVRLEEIPDTSEEPLVPAIAQEGSHDRLSPVTPMILRFNEIGGFQDDEISPPVITLALPSFLSKQKQPEEQIDSSPASQDDQLAPDLATTESAVSETLPNLQLAFAAALTGQRISARKAPERSSTPGDTATMKVPQAVRGPVEIPMPKAAPKSMAPPARAPKFETPATGTTFSATEAAPASGRVNENSKTPKSFPNRSINVNVPDTDPVLTTEPLTRADLTPATTPPPLAAEALPRIEPITPLPPAKNTGPVTKPKGQPDDAALSGQNGSWKPLDMKTIELDTYAAARPRPEVTQAAPQDKLLAQDSLRMAFESAQKRMYFAARARFIEALRIIARSLDDQSGIHSHARSLRVALQAYEEAADFFPQATHLDQEIDLAAILSGHDTQLLQSADTRNLTPRQCLREYMAVAEQEFSRALKHEPLGSQALYGLGRLQSIADSGIQQSAHVRAHRSIMLFQTALRVDSNNFAAANELGVLLARYGQYPAAIAALQHSVSVSPQPAAWMNLARVHEKLGQINEARLASQRAAELADTRAPSPITLASRPQIEWVDARTFAGMPNDQAANDQVVNNSRPRPPVTQRTAVAPAKKKVKPWFWPE